MFQIIVVNLICCIIFPLFVFWKAKIYENNTWNSEALSKNDTGCIRGIAAFFVLFAHVLIELSDMGIGSLGPAVLYKWCGGLGVCVFFFVSGYGLWMSCDNKKIDANFIMKRLNNILPTYFFIRLIAIVLLKKYEMGLGYTVLYFLSIKESAWFVVEMLLIYFIFYYAIRYGKSNAIYYIFVALIVMSIVFIVLGFDARWYNANLNFGFGVLLARYRKEYIAKITNTEKEFWLINIGMIFCFGITAILFTMFKGCLWANIFKLLAGGFFSLVLVNIVLKINLHSKGLLYVGKYSLQLYLLHMVVIEWFSEIVNDNWDLSILFLIEVLVSVFVLGVYCWIENKLKVLIK